MSRLTLIVLMLGISAGLAAAAEEPSPRREALVAAKQIDQLVEANYAKQDVKPNAMTGDEQFLRRAYLDIIGRIPTYDEAVAFLESKESDKRYDLIDQLLDSEGYVSHTFNYWADVLRIKSRLTNQVAGGPYIDWIKRAIRDNKPYDQFVYEMLTAQGRVRDDGAAGYMIRDSGMPLDNMANTVRIFLGTRIGCAQCHDHPFDKWTQHEFYELAAFTAGTVTRQKPEGMMKARQAAKAADLNDQQEKILRRVLVSESFAVSDTPRKLRLPDDYKYSDAKPGDVVKPLTIFGAAMEPTGDQTPRLVFAGWLTDKENPRLAPVIANRLWKRAMGVGLVEPVDDFTEDTKASNPQLLEYLTQRMKAVQFDTQAYLRAIYYSRVYQRQATAQEPARGEPYHFSGPVLRRMSAEQLWDSVLTLIVPDLDGREGIANSEARYGTMDFDPSKLSQDELLAKVKEISVQRGGKGGGKNRQREMMDGQPEKYRGIPPQFVRASEGIFPAPPGTFLEQFGSSDRELIEGSDANPTVAQALAMLNGEASNGVLNSRSLLTQTVKTAKSPPQQARIVFLSILGRQPSASDTAIALEEIRNDPKAGLRNVAAALLNSREFMFVQ